MPPRWSALTVEAQTTQRDSTLALYKRALALRRAHDALRTGSFAWRASEPGTLVFERTANTETIVCAVNISADTVELADAELLLASKPSLTSALPPDTAAWWREERRR